MSYKANLIESMKADGWRQCAKGQGESQYCGMLEAEKAKAYAQGQKDMRERAALVADDAYPSHTLGGEAKAISTAIRALPLEGEAE